jgi:alkylated DNA repair dioxygenase AlkB
MYEDGNDSLGWHADDDPGIDHTRPIAVITLGQGREIWFKENVKGSHPQRLFLEPGSLLLMHAGMQSTHLHSIPKAAREIGPRISMTYRGLVT